MVLGGFRLFLVLALSSNFFSEDESPFKYDCLRLKKGEF